MGLTSCFAAVCPAGGAAIVLHGAVVRAGGITPRLCCCWRDPNLIQGRFTPTSDDLPTLELTLPGGKSSRTMVSELGLPDGLRQDLHVWEWPLPNAGPVEIACEWPAAGIARGMLVLDAEVIRRAAGGPPP